MDYGLIVIGGGAAGLSSARAGVQRGRTTLLISDGPLGGDCTFTGCVPSKTLIESARRGLSFTMAMERVRDVVARIASTEDVDVLRSEGVVVREGRARFLDPTSIAVDGDRFTARRIVIATGSAPIVPHGEGWEPADYLTTETVFDLTSAPASMAIIGAGPIGCELGQAFHRLGVSTTLIEAEGTLLPHDDPDAGSTLADVFTREGIGMKLGSRVSHVERRGPNLIDVRLGDGSSVAVERLLVAGGRRPVVESLDVEAGGLTLDESGFIITDDHLATSSPGIFAVGDVTGRFPHTHGADEMGRIAVANACSRLGHRKFRISGVPWVTFTDPEIARVGMTEQEAATVEGRVAFLPMTEVDRAVTADRTDGFVKLLAGPRRVGGNLGGGKLLGATIVSERAGELIHEVALAMRSGMFTGRLAQTVHAYPTWSMAIRQAAGQFFAPTGGREARPARTAGSEAGRQ